MPDGTGIPGKKRKDANELETIRPGASAGAAGGDGVFLRQLRLWGIGCGQRGEGPGCGSDLRHEPDQRRTVRGTYPAAGGDNPVGDDSDPDDSMGDADMMPESIINKMSVEQYKDYLNKKEILRERKLRQREAKKNRLREVSTNYRNLIYYYRFLDRYRSLVS